MTVPPDKSITHRALIFGAMANGCTIINNPLTALDTISTANCLRSMGAEIKFGAKWMVRGGNLFGAKIDCGNSGTTMRLLMGVAAGLKSTTIFDGDSSLKKRPMDRVTKPLSLMGAKCEGLKITGGDLCGIDYELPIPSAQVKSAIILAGLRAKGETILRGRIDSRDHTENMLAKMGASILQKEGSICVQSSTLQATEFYVPGDASSAAYVAALALLIPQGYAYIRKVTSSKTRLGFFDVLKRAGADIAISKNGDEADIVVNNSEFMGFEVDEKEIPYLIDEIPLLSLVACFAKGTSIINDVSELTVKESNRLVETQKLISSLGGQITVNGNKIIITGSGKLDGGGVYDGYDHRMVMTAAIGYAVGKKEGIIVHHEAVNISYPEFFELFE